MEEQLHDFRREIDANIKFAEQYNATPGATGAREMALVRTKLQEAKMWTGKVLEQLGSKLPEEFRDEAK